MSESGNKPGLVFSGRGMDPQDWLEPLREMEPDRPFFGWPDVSDPASVGYAIVWQPPAGFFAGLPNLRAIFSVGAGVDSLLSRDDLPDVQIVRAVNPDMTQRMAEWITLQVLIHHRHQRVYDAQQRGRIWAEIERPAASEVRVGIMGMGVLGGQAAGILARIGYRVAGWSRRPADVPNVESFFGRDQLDAFLARTSILVSVLPLTPETRGILAAPLFHKLARDPAFGPPVLINAGRGGSQVETDIVAALDEGILGGASLDVFEHEPLDAASPLWSRQNVVITPHAAAASVPSAIGTGFLRQIQAFERGEPLPNVVDRSRFY